MLIAILFQANFLWPFRKSMTRHSRKPAGRISTYSGISRRLAQLETRIARARAEDEPVLYAHVLPGSGASGSAKTFAL
ncbi:hypothetical protein [Paraburkholderia hayleyella]|uniref:hypothetical protein n=1 Tax=Paraburkholderia hayleyella TaxID=2152889 RepID=UPI001580FE38|nr:hypothetical protein [Paraburkholderia hayleyella]